MFHNYPRRNANTHDGVDSYMRTEFRVDNVHTQNLEYLDRPYGFDEFCDIDNELADLTVQTVVDDVQLFEFCTGYNVL